MKRLILIFITFISIQTFAQSYSNITVFSEDGKPFYLMLNGIKQNEKAQTNIKVEGLTLPQYQAQIVFEDQSIPTISKGLAAKDVDGNFAEVAYRIKQNKKGEYKLRVFTFTPMDQLPPVLPGMEVVQFSSTPVEETKTETVTTTVTTTAGGNTGGTGENVSMGMNVNGMNVSMNVNVNDAQMSSSQTTTTTTSTTTSSSSSAGIQTIPDDGCNGASMSPSEFTSAKGSINSKTFEDSKLSIAKQITKANCLSAAQVKEIMLLFTYEDSKLDFAKFAYPYTFDKGNYFKVNDAFEFESTIEELQDFID